MSLSNDVSLILRKTAEKLLPYNRVSVYKSPKAVVLSYFSAKKNQDNNEKNTLSIPFSDIEKYKGPVEDYLTRRVELFKGLFTFLKDIMPDIAFISEDESTVGVTIKTSVKNSDDYIRLYYEKDLFQDFRDDPTKTKKIFFNELEKKESMIKNAI
jgi:hypothetical protein